MGLGVAKGQEFSRLYRDVSDRIAQALDNMSAVHLAHPEGNAHLEHIRSRLAVMRNAFDGEIGYLSDHAEWEKFTIAFFGETNAGKSTIVEALRVIFNEQQRQEKISARQAAVADMQAEFSRGVDELMEVLVQECGTFRDDVARLAEEVASLAALTREDNERARQARRRRTLTGYALFLLSGAAFGALAQTLLS